jgi:hypothetical protein
MHQTQVLSLAEELRQLIHAVGHDPRIAGLQSSTALLHGTEVPIVGAQRGSFSWGNLWENDESLAFWCKNYVKHDLWHFASGQI